MATRHLRDPACDIDARAPGDPGYAVAVSAWNTNAVQRPARVVMAGETADVQAAVRHARDTGLGVGVMATGHGVGRPADGGVLVNTSRMRGVQVDPAARTVRVQAGALWGDVIPAAAAHGLATLAGSAPHVGVVGYTMGGGFGWLGRRYGLNSAGVTAAHLVTADGRRRRVHHDEHPELLWGLAGSGGNLGIVTSLEFRLHPLATVYGGAAYHPVERAAAVLDRYVHWTANLPDEMTTAVAFMNIPAVPSAPAPLRGRSVVVVKGCWCGARPDDGEAMFRPVRDGLGEPILDTFGLLPVEDMDRISRDPVDPMGIVQYTGMLSALSPDAVDALVAVAGAGSGSTLLLVELRQLGGALDLPPRGLRPMGGGAARFSLNVLGTGATREAVDRVQAQIARLADATRPYQTGEVFLNFLEVAPDPNRVRAAYPPDDWHRLVGLKDTYDPHNLFRFNRNIPPSRTSARPQPA